MYVYVEIEFNITLAFTVFKEYSNNLQQITHFMHFRRVLHNLNMILRVFNYCLNRAILHLASLTTVASTTICSGPYSGEDAWAHKHGWGTSTLKPQSRREAVLLRVTYWLKETY